jgi:hypothetical protein
MSVDEQAREEETAEKIALWLEDYAEWLGRERERGGDEKLEYLSYATKTFARRIRQGDWKEKLPIKRLGD